MERYPRKIKKSIPNGRYCYKVISFENYETNQKYEINICKFYDSIKSKDKPIHLQDEIDLEFPDEYIGWCKLIKYEIDDQCKSCGIKLNY